MKRLVVILMGLLAGGSLEAEQKLYSNSKERQAAIRIIALSETGEVSAHTFDGNGNHPSTENVEKLWIWTEKLAPRSIRPEALYDSLRRIGTLPADEQRVVTINLGARRKGAGAEQQTCSGRLHAAPVEMWEAVPEGLIPAWTVSSACKVSIPRLSSEPWLMRFIGGNAGSWWQGIDPDVPQFVLQSSPAVDRAYHLVTEQREQSRAFVPIPRARITLLTVDRNLSGAKAMATFQADENGIVTIPSLPDGPGMRILAGAPGFRSKLIGGGLQDELQKIFLEAGHALQGRFVDATGRPIPEALVRLERWANDEIPWMLHTQTRSGSDGRWQIGGQAPGSVVLRVDADGFASLRRPLELEAKDHDVKDLILYRGRELQIEVVDPEGRPLVAAEVRLSDQQLSTTREGMTIFEDLPPEESKELRVSCAGFQERRLSVPTPVPDQMRVELKYAFSVLGQFADSLGNPVSDAEMDIRFGNSSTSSKIESEESRFRAELPPGVPVELRFSSPTSSEARLVIGPGAPGEVRELGLVKAPPGLVVTGRVSRPIDSSPMAEARVWTLRPQQTGPVVAWMLADFLETRTDAEGQFRFTGHPAMPFLLRIDAPGWARMYRLIIPEPGEFLIELGDLYLEHGGSLEVVTDETWTGLARLDLRGDELPADILEESLHEGRATFDHVPSERAWLSVVKGQKVLCEQEVSIPAGGHLEVECGEETVLVSGLVLIEEQPSEKGQLVWTREKTSSEFAGALTLVATNGLRQRHGFGMNRHPVRVEVEDAGLFSTTDLGPGVWNVVWYAQNGLTSELRGLEIPDVESYEMTLELPGVVVSGRVVDEDHSPAPGARVHELSGQAFAVVDESGMFKLAGGSGEAWQLQAFHGDMKSDVITLELTTENVGDPLVLVLRKKRAQVTDVQVMGFSGNPVSGAMVFVESIPGGQRILTTGGDGKAQLRFEDPLPNRVRFAVHAEGSWVFEAWREWAEDASLIDLRLEEVGSMNIFSEELTGILNIDAPGGWNLTRMLQRLGFSPSISSSSPLILSGLPHGSYQVSSETKLTQVEIEPNEVSELYLGELK